MDIPQLRSSFQKAKSTKTFGTLEFWPRSRRDAPVATGGAVSTMHPTQAVGLFRCSSTMLDEPYGQPVFFIGSQTNPDRHSWHGSDSNSSSRVLSEDCTCAATHQSWTIIVLVLWETHVACRNAHGNSYAIRCNANGIQNVYSLGPKLRHRIPSSRDQRHLLASDVPSPRSRIPSSWTALTSGRTTNSAIYWL